MRLLRLLILCVFILSFITLSHAQSATTDSLLNKLNTVLANRDSYVNDKEQAIVKIKEQLKNANTEDLKHTVYDELYEQYKSFSYDSAYTYAKKLQTSSFKLNNPLFIAQARMKLGFTLLSSGLFKETLENLNNIDLKYLPNEVKVAYYFLKARSYFDLSDYNRNPDFSAIYDPKGVACIDSALAISTPGSFSYLELKGLEDLRRGNNDEGLKVYTALLKIPNLSPHDFAVNACCLSYIYEKKGIYDKSINLLIEAAISDIQSATKETVAAYKLADLMYKKGNIENAYTYIKQAMDDATFYGALHRQAQISSILPIIEAQWISQIEHQKKLLYMYSFIITLLVVFVVVFAVIIFRQLKKLRIADEIIIHKNNDLNTANASLIKVNKRLDNANRTLSQFNSKLDEANMIKDEYIGYFFNTHSDYIEKLDRLKRSIEKNIKEKRYEEVGLIINRLNTNFERENLSHSFDKVFLNIFPGFVQDFNALFDAGHQIHLHDGQLLNTELRIFALIRLGIHDNETIGKILNYSVNTIYTYKTKVKNKSLIANDEFEDKIMLIKAVKEVPADMSEKGE